MFALHLVDIADDLITAWQQAFKGLPDVTITHGRFEDVPEFDCLVSPANSFGIMDGGIDLAISYFFGWELMESVQKRILRDFFGEQPVGTSMIVPTNNPVHPYLAHYTSNFMRTLAPSTHRLFPVRILALST